MFHVGFDEIPLEEQLHFGAGTPWDVFHGWGDEPDLVLDQRLRRHVLALRFWDTDVGEKGRGLRKDSLFERSALPS